MINITDKNKCCGCEACSQICPKSCIIMKPDEEGFYYPIVDDSLCIDCGLCEKTCPIINMKEPQTPLNVFAGVNPNEDIRRNSSSGGVFSHIAEKVLSEGGYIVGAVFDENWEVHHIVSNSQDDLRRMRGSKYVQSRLEGVYKEVKKLLDDGKLVLFSGISCQVSAMLLYLRKPYENLITIELICAGVPSPGLWKQYLEEEVYPAVQMADAGKNSVLSLKKDSTIADISFRDKSTGWKKFSLVVRNTL